MDITRSELARLTVGKTSATIALRWIPFFLPTLAVAFTASTAQLTAIIGIGEMFALVTLLAGRHFDAGYERPIMAGGLVLISLSSWVALVGNLVSFALGFLMLIIGMSLYTVGGHTYLSRRTSFDQRGRAIGLFETSWAAALLVGAPLIALLINAVGWRGPFVAIGITTGLLSIVVARTHDTASGPVASATPVIKQPITRAAWRIIFASAALAMAGLGIIVIAGTWLDDQLGVSTSGVGVVAMAFGLAELTSSLTSAGASDRLGKVRSARAMATVLLVGLVVMSQAGTSLAVGATGLILVFLGFEYAFVTSFSIVSEVMPDARGRALVAGNAVGTVLRGGAAVASGLLYDRFGINGPAALSAVGAVAAIVLLTQHQRSNSGQEMNLREQRDFLTG